MYCPCRRFMSKTMRMFSDRSSRYHSLMRPLICRAFLLPFISVSALSATAMKRMPQRGNRLWMYFSTNSMSRVNRDWLLQRMIWNFFSWAAWIIRVKSGRRLSAPE